MSKRKHTGNSQQLKITSYKLDGLRDPKAMVRKFVRVAPSNSNLMLLRPQAE